MAHGIFVGENCAYTKNGALIKSCRLSADVDNGKIVKIGALEDGQREIHSATLAGVTDTYFGIVANPEVDKEHDYISLSNYTNAAGGETRVVIPQKGDCYAVTVEDFGGTAPKKGQFVEIGANGNHKAVDTQTAGSTQIGKVAEVYTSGGVTLYSVEVQ